MDCVNLGRAGLPVSRLCLSTVNFGPPGGAGQAADAHARRTEEITGPSTVARLGAAQRALAISLDDGVLKRLDSLFPGCRPAPEHCAW